VVVVDPTTPEQEGALRAELSTPSFDIDLPPLGDGSLPERLVGADALVVWETAVDDALLAAAPRLKLVVGLGSAKGAIDEAAARRRGVEVRSVPSPALISVAEHAILLMLALVKELIPAHRGVVAGAYPDDLRPTPTTQTNMAYNWLGLERFDALFGKTLGLVGFGVIGRAVAERARAFGMEVLYAKPRRLDPPAEVALGVRYAGIDELLGRADVVSLHLRVTPETEGLIGAREFSLMKPTAFFVNTARGALVDEAALVEALQSRRIAGAGIDVFREEPLPRDSPLATLGNVVLTPHSAGIPLARSRIWELAAAGRVIREFAFRERAGKQRGA
jgi:D-3-phosphoglycerate dehydrogenase